MTHPEGTPTTPAWSCDLAPEDTAPIPVPITFDNGITYHPGIGHFNTDGEPIIGLPATHSRAVLRALVNGSFTDQLSDGLRLDSAAEGK